ncbi:MAG: NAD(P)H-dependent glycerol-3-phosphate dehydrogenase [Holosporales bacterium]|jgi:glycerol-3-phosphate dehydrogenase (NAD(P)+)|nr:NAD(P)H-dependent glycerol-3-phosphate dehydrogenase [Holosporales bacterium]
MQRAGVIGAGAFGTAIAVATASRWKDVFLYSDLPSVVCAINSLRLNPQFLPGIGLPQHFIGHQDLATANSCDVLFLCVPAQVVRTVCTSLEDQHLSSGIPIIVCSKGIEIASGLLIGEVIASMLSNPVYILSGPSFAQELARCLPTTVTIAGQESEAVTALKSTLETPTFRVMPSLDLIGAQVGGALKNLLAVGAGLVLGAGLGENARAVLVTKGFQEMQRIVQVLGGDPETLLGMSGFGDIFLTCMSNTSRNTTFGVRVAKGEISIPLKEPFQGPLAEGALTAAAWQAFKTRFAHAETPVFTALYEALCADRSLTDAFKIICE